MGVSREGGNRLKQIVFIVLWCMGTLYATESSSAKEIKLAQKGERIVKVMCDRSKLPKAEEGAESVEVIIKKIKASHACSPLSKDKIEAVAYYLKHGKIDVNKSRISVPKDAKCPVCGMFVSKYPKWTTTMVHDGKRFYFDGVKDMMKYYIFDGDFPYDRSHISEMVVSDYYTIDEIPAKEAFYVLDADVFGPMGHELIAFKDKKSAQTFMAEHHGKKIVRFGEITGKMLMALDGIVQ